MALAGLLNSSCVIRRSTVGATRDAYGKPISTVADLPAVPCRRERLSADEMLGSTQAVVATDRIWFEYGAGVLQTDQLVIDGLVFDVASVDANVAAAGHHVEVLAKQVKG